MSNNWVGPVNRLEILHFRSLEILLLVVPMCSLFLKGSPQMNQLPSTSLPPGLNGNLKKPDHPLKAPST